MDTVQDGRAERNDARQHVALSALSMQPDLLTYPEAAAALRVHYKTLRKWVATGRLPIVRLGRRVYVRRTVLAALIDAQSEAATCGPLAGRTA